jgi:hypothetical protein
MSKWRNRLAKLQIYSTIWLLLVKTGHLWSIVKFTREDVSRNAQEIVYSFRFGIELHVAFEVIYRKTNSVA